jgi:hypothetical protein
MFGVAGNPFPPISMFLIEFRRWMQFAAASRIGGPIHRSILGADANPS